MLNYVFYFLKHIYIHYIDKIATHATISSGKRKSNGTEILCLLEFEYVNRFDWISAISFSHILFYPVLQTRNINQEIEVFTYICNNFFCISYGTDEFKYLLGLHM